MNKDIPDSLFLYRGHPHKIKDGVVIRVPTLEEICVYGEGAYYSMVYTLCSVGIDLCWQLEEAGIPFDEITDFELFYSVLRNYYAAEQTKILFGDTLNLKEMSLCKLENGEICLAQRILTDQGESRTITIDERDYYEIVSYLRAMHGLKRNNAVAGTKSCRMAFIEDAKAAHEAQKLTPRKSYLLPLISTMVNYDGFKRDDQTVWDMNLFAFMDSIRRIDKIRNSNLLLQSGYSGFGVDLKKVNKEELNYLGELD